MVKPTVIMSLGLTFFLSLLATAGLFGGLYFLVLTLVEGRRTKAKPRFGLAKGAEPGTLAFWIQWDPTQFEVAVYRVRISHVSPENVEQEGMFSVSYEPPNKEPFIQDIQLPANFLKLVETATSATPTLFTVDFKTIEGLSMIKEMTAGTLKKFYDGTKGAIPKGLTNRLPVRAADHPTVMTLEFQELVAYNQRVKKLEAAMKAKQAKAAAAPPKPAAAAPPATPKPETGAPPAGSTTQPPPAPAAATATATNAAPKSVREVVSASKSKNVEG